MNYVNKKGYSASYWTNYPINYNLNLIILGLFLFALIKSAYLSISYPVQFVHQKGIDFVTLFYIFDYKEKNFRYLYIHINYLYLIALDS